MWGTIVKSAVGFFSGSSIYLYLAIVVFIAAIGSGFYYMDYKIEQKDKTILEFQDALTFTGTELNKTILTNEENQKEFDKYKLDQEKSLTALSEQHKKELNDAIIYEKIKGEITHVKKNDDAPTAPILIDTINRLWDQTNSNNKNSN
ncbi:hypothetical protein [Arcobacter sp.]|uniref:hypothetical protein n=1 Tax=unclassified Arcobacter TaxID=2593671 RepID=UPI003B0024BF